MRLAFLCPRLAGAREADKGFPGPLWSTNEKQQVSKRPGTAGLVGL
jgi:hypothetical protein